MTVCTRCAFAGAAIVAGMIAIAGNGTASDALTAIVITLAVTVALTVAGLVALLVIRANRPRLTYRRDPGIYARTCRAEVMASAPENGAERPARAISAPERLALPPGRPVRLPARSAPRPGW
jgi:hypothetical protein